MLNFLSTSNISPLLLHYGYLIYFPFVIIEGPIVTIIAGFLVSLGYFNFLIIGILSVIGNLICDAIYYVIGRKGLPVGRFLGIKNEQVNKLEEHFKSHSGKTLLFGKWTHYLGAPILLAAGMSRMPFKKFILFSAIGETPKSFVLLIAGYYFGQAYQQIDKYFGYAWLIVFFVIILIAVIYFLCRKFHA